MWVGRLRLGKRRIAASPILQEYDAFTEDELEVNPASQFENLTDS